MVIIAVFGHLDRPTKRLVAFRFIYMFVADEVIDDQGVNAEPSFAVEFLHGAGAQQRIENVVSARGIGPVVIYVFGFYR